MSEDTGPKLGGNKVPALLVDPPAAIVPVRGGVCTVMLINPSAVRLAFKMRSSNNENYRLRPVYGFIDATSMTPLEIIRITGPLGSDRLVAQYKVAAINSKNPQLLFKTGTHNGEVTIPLTAQ